MKINFKKPGGEFGNLEMWRRIGKSWKSRGELGNLEIWSRIVKFWGNDKFGNLEEVDEFQEMCLS